MAKIISKVVGTVDNIYYFSVVEKMLEENHV